MALLRRGPVDEWTLREKLTLGGAVLRIGDNNWSAVSKAVRPLGEDLRPAEWFSPKNCALQYSDLLDKADVHKRKRGEKGLEDPPEKVMVRSLAQERIEELSRIINKEQEQYRILKMDVENIRAGIFDPKLADIWEQMVKEKEAQKRAEEEALLRQSASAVVTSVSSSATTPRVTKKLARPQAQNLTLSVGPDGDAGALRGAQQPKTEPTDGEETPPAAFLSMSMSDADTDPGDETARASMSLPPLPAVEEAIPEVVKMEGPEVEVVLDGEVTTPIVEDVKEEVIEEQVETVIEEPVIEETLKLEEPMDVVATEVEMEEKPSPIPTTPAIEEEKPAPAAAAPPPEITPKVEPTITTVAETPPETSEPVPESSETLSVGGEVTSGISTEVPPSPASSVGSRLSEAPTPSQTSKSSRRPGRKSKGRKGIRHSTRTHAESETSVGGEEKMASEAEEGSSEQITPLPSTPLLPESTPASPASFTHSDTEDERAYKAWKKSIIMVWRAAANHKYANVFMAPVTDEIAPGYNSIIKRPLDLVTIKKNIETGQLRSTTVFQRNIMLMFTNALMYNSEDHHVHEMAKEMYDDVMAHIQQFVSTQLMVSSAAESKSLRATRRADTERASSVDRDDDRKRQSESETSTDAASKPKKRKI